MYKGKILRNVKVEGKIKKKKRANRAGMKHRFTLEQMMKETQPWVPVPVSVPLPPSSLSVPSPL